MLKIVSMAKRRTRKEKERAKHTFTFTFEPDVKRQKKGELKAQNLKLDAYENAKLSAKDSQFEPIKRDIVKSLILASLILGLELVIYLGWNRG
ncbi:MAG: hypothetical protein UT72_C0006G0011 [Candidatus Woesebacteria bacterium GW2011_GWB1_40_101]|uniref:Uncharacterized protein n=4 Tax=Candidatus Woeseibacteriota TaxID=1752722 RepID=A0A0G0TNY5_9BACT|nr:MAG: hypothetical protein UT72_C0006G0011 [Candidatus Woesebacteria bacterium GW2011_GWB1_40_101]